MKKRLHDQKAGIAILTALFIISLLEVVFRVGCLRQSLLTTTNAGQPHCNFCSNTLNLYPQG